MARQGKVGILIEVQDQFSGGLKKVGAGLSKAGSSARKFGASASKAFGKVKLDIISVNQALELGVKAWDMLKQGISLTVGASLEARAETDLQKKAWTDFMKVVKDVRTALGDALMPILKGISQALTPILNQVKTWIGNNKDLIASKVVEWMTNFARIAVKGIAFGIIQINKAWTGWKLISAVVSAALNKFFAMVLSGVDKVIGSLARMTKFAGLDGLTAKLNGARAVVKGLGAEFERSGEANVAAVKKEVAELDVFEKKVLSVRDATLKVIDDVKKKSNAATGDAITKAAGDAVNGVNKGSGKKAEEAGRKAFDARNKVVDREAVALEASAMSLSEMTGMLGEISGTFSTLLSAFSGLGGDGDGPLHGGPLNAILTVGKTLLSFIPGFNKGGPIGYASGGFVSGGTAGRDSVPAMLTPGEYVIPAPIVDSIRKGKAPDQKGRFNSGGMVTPQNGAGIAPSATNILAFATSGAEVAKIERDYFARQRKRLKRNRVL